MKGNNILGSRLEQCRKNAGLTQKQLADILHVQRQIISYYEKGSRKPDIDMLKTLSNHFAVSTDYLLGLTDVKTPDTTVQAIAEYTGLDETAISALNKNTNALNATKSFAHKFFKEQSDFANFLILRVLSNSFSEICGSIVAFKNNSSDAKKLYERNIDPDNPFAVSTSAEEKKMLAKARRAQIIEWFGSALDEYFTDEMNGLQQAEDKHNRAVQGLIDEMIAQEQERIEEQ